MVKSFLHRLWLNILFNSNGCILTVFKDPMMESPAIPKKE